MNEMFDFEKVENFDDHISLSIQNYGGLFDLFKALCFEFCASEGTVVDIGCSSGRFLGSLTPLNCIKIGCDVVDIRSNNDFTFRQEKASETLRALDKVDVICSMFTLQFMGKSEREEVLHQMHKLVKSGAVLLISEKVYADCPVISAVLQRELTQSKRGKFTADQILDKEASLRGRMFCKRCSEVERELLSVGEVHQVWQAHLFKAWVVK
jgi:SAM-dependent methyltransferase